MKLHESDLVNFNGGQNIAWNVHCAPPSPETDDCDNSGPNCLKTARIAGMVAIGDTKPEHDGSVLLVPEASMQYFTAAARAGEFAPIT